MNLHRLAEQRSLAYHRAVAGRLAGRPELMQIARERASRWESQGSLAAAAWVDLLAQPLPALLEFLGSDSERARELRQSTPFAGMLDPRERWRLWEQVRRQFEG
jgi:hypothetical protein